MFKDLTIASYRSVGDQLELGFAIPENGALGLTVIVGPNNVGKSTIINAIELFNQENHLIDREDRRENSGVQAALTLCPSDQKLEVKQIESATHSVESWSDAPFDERMYQIVYSRRHWDVRNPNGPMSADEFRGPYNLRPKETSDGEFVRRLMEIATSEDRHQLTNSMRKLVPAFSKWSIDRMNGTNVALYETGAGHEHVADLTGDGVTSLLRICVALLDTPQGGTCIVDEPELSLHPQAQRRLAGLLAEEAKNKQIIVTTHSPHFIRWADLSGGARLWRLNKYDDVQTTAHQLEPKTINALSSLAGDWQKPQMMDELAKEIFFAEGVLFLEGQEDVGLFRKEIRARDLECEFDLFGYGTGGGGNIKKYLQAAADIGVPAGALYDGDLTHEHGSAKEMFPNSKVEIAPTDDIRDKMKRDCQGGTAMCKETTEVVKAGMFTKSGSLKQAYEGDFIGLIESFNTYFTNWKNP